MAKRIAIWLVVLTARLIVAVCVALAANATGLWVLILALMAAGAIGPWLMEAPSRTQRRHRQAALSMRQLVPVDEQLGALELRGLLDPDMNLADKWRLVAGALRVDPDRMRWDDPLTLYHPLPHSTLGGDLDDLLEDSMGADGSLLVRIVTDQESKPHLHRLQVPA